MTIWKMTISPNTKTEHYKATESFVSGLNVEEASLTFEFVVVGVCREQHVWEELLKAVSSIARPVLHVSPHRLVELHHELLRRCAQLLDHLVPLVNVFRWQAKENYWLSDQTKIWWLPSHIHLWAWSTKPVLSHWGIFVAIANNTLYGSKLLFFLLCQKSLGY